MKPDGVLVLGLWLQSLKIAVDLCTFNGDGRGQDHGGRELHDVDGKI